MTNKQPDLIKEARELLAGVTQWPWVVFRDKHVEIASAAENADRLKMVAHVYKSGMANGTRYRMPVLGNANLIARAPDLLSSLADELERARKSLKSMLQLWDDNNPDDPCGCVGASDDCRHPPVCECCVARLIADGRTKELFED